MKAVIWVKIIGLKKVNSLFIFNSYCGGGGIKVHPGSQFSSKKIGVNSFREIYLTSGLTLSLDTANFFYTLGEGNQGLKNAKREDPNQGFY